VPEDGPTPVEDGSEPATPAAPRRPTGDVVRPPETGAGMNRRAQIIEAARKRAAEEEARKRAAEEEARTRKAKADTTSAKDKR
jgi:hypothetical protein